jgi:hypothetical protein
MLWDIVAEFKGDSRIKQNQRPNSKQGLCVFPNIAFDDELRYNEN